MASSQHTSRHGSNQVSTSDLSTGTTIINASVKEYDTRPSWHKSPITAFRRSWVEDIDTDSFRFCVTLFGWTLATGMQLLATLIDFPINPLDQTGHLVRLGGNKNPTNSMSSGETLKNIGMVMGFFALGTLITGQTAVKGDRAKKRWWLFLSFLFQAGLSFTAAGLRMGRPAAAESSTKIRVLAEMGLLAFIGGVQIGTIRPLKTTADLNTIQFFFAIVDTLVDPKLFKPRNRDRTRRCIYIAMVIAGTFSGWGLYKATHHNFGSGIVLLVGAAIKAVLSLYLLFFVVAERERADPTSSRRSSSSWV